MSCSRSSPSPPTSFSQPPSSSPSPSPSRDTRLTLSLPSPHHLYHQDQKQALCQPTQYRLRSNSPGKTLARYVITSLALSIILNIPRCKDKKKAEDKKKIKTTHMGQFLQDGKKVHPLSKKLFLKLHCDQTV